MPWRPAMIVIPNLTAVAIGAVVFVLLAAGAALLFVGLRARRQAVQVMQDNRALQAMLRTSSSLAMVVRGDGRVDMPPSLADWFGLVALIGSGYRFFAYVLLAVFVLPLCTVGVARIVAGARSRRQGDPDVLATS